MQKSQINGGRQVPTTTIESGVGNGNSGTVIHPGSGMSPAERISGASTVDETVSSSRMHALEQIVGDLRTELTNVRTQLARTTARLEVAENITVRTALDDGSAFAPTFSVAEGEYQKLIATVTARLSAKSKAAGLTDHSAESIQRSMWDGAWDDPSNYDNENSRKPYGKAPRNPDDIKFNDLKKKGDKPDPDIARIPRDQHNQPNQHNPRSQPNININALRKAPQPRQGASDADLELMFDKSRDGGFNPDAGGF